ncbi:MAG: 50S ribosomal protein L29 [Candidatus Sungbacteria bacterium]|uniref:Large ribosomal subunit protein uL29 n=1 Tax=Candidatus Sungiibacteriota bacterium TaxID=2750080 RepID=A0A9D6LSY0_9BACT|nr:50S ribosomal protein L29 [Candidatus Sungbacteria bacterium]
MKAIELRKKTKDELTNKLLDLRAKVETLRFDTERKKVKNVKSLAGVKKDIARILTVIREQ